MGAGIKASVSSQGVTEHQALIARALVLVAGRVDANGDVGGLGMNVDVNLGVLPVKALLLVADLAHRGASYVFQVPMGDAIGPPNFARQNNLIGRAQGLAGHPGFRHRGQVGVHNRVRNAVGYLVGMALGNRFTGEQVIG